MSIKRYFLAALLAFAAPTAWAAPDNLVLAIGGEPAQGFDPLLGWGAYGNPLFQSTLLKRGVELQTEPDLALDWQLSDDRRVWTITLRQDAKFSDGQALTAQDVAFTFTKAKAAAGAVDLQVMERAEALSDHQLQITLSKPWITFVEAFYTLGIVPAASYGPGYGRNPIGSGPYQMVSWSEGAQLIVKPNPHYYGPKGIFPQITFLFTGDDAGLAAAHAGAVHMVSVPAQMASAKPAGFHAVAVPTVDNRGISLPFLPPQEGKAIGNAVTSDPAIRAAINLGLDRDLIVDVALYGHGSAAIGPVDGLPWAGTDTAVRYDPEAAKALLDQAGWRLGPDGIRAKDGLKAAFTLHYPASDATRQALAETSAELLRPLGFDIRAKGGSWEMIERVMHQDPVVFGFGSHSPYQLYSLYAAELSGVAWSNPSYYENPQVEAAFTAAQTAPSFEASLPFWQQAAAHYGPAGDNAWAWLVNLDHVYLVQDCLDLGPTQREPHGHGWPITVGLPHWQWSCE